MCAEWSAFEEQTHRGWTHVLNGLERELDAAHTVKLPELVASQAVSEPSKASAP
jgi:hypothetical protein